MIYLIIVTLLTHSCAEHRHTHQVVSRLPSIAMLLPNAHLHKVSGTILQILFEIVYSRRRLLIERFCVAYAYVLTM